MGSREDDAYWNEKYDQTSECETHGVELHWSEDVEDYECPECAADWDAYLHG